jgi:ATP-dependent exoDNAse (exonuclease V) beta subunit
VSYEKKHHRIAADVKADILRRVKQEGVSVAQATDDNDLEEIYNTERHLLYVACTRARDHLFVTSVEPASEFLDDLRV